MSRKDSRAYLYWQGRLYRIFRSQRPFHRRISPNRHEKICSQPSMHRFIGRVHERWTKRWIYRDVDERRNAHLPQSSMGYKHLARPVPLQWPGSLPKKMLNPTKQRHDSSTSSPFSSSRCQPVEPAWASTNFSKTARSSRRTSPQWPCSAESIVG